ncbi:actin-histidine N-methyltransferase isoform X2 [Gallus gallus]|uniref:protein-histidine N-methyltransferase n=1 Tax=Gallus gallus TaxID=9031 RepID=A0A8V0YNV1_CHICK|nr:actin-histidine N-methyltransferase isoform X2 [Gallus gallus]XP_046774630.1 actin-histidine N-methyltransferase isoform X2 [Gallus gallus]XP_046797772.1 actin-histidine N-methyltransferase isoform X2 [Gallus gallus]XP_046797773.1 actin-histidine N-methyltransferase isoform X2 [Gallus gallus]XP_046797774.1 actin-histidine N-methyltransferase isoform X2 [Gallus gallus]
MKRGEEEPAPSLPSWKMGKKSRVKTQKSGTGATAAVSPKELLNLTSELLQKCSSPTPGPGKEWEEYIQIRSLVEKIRKKQKGLSVVFDGKRDDYFPELIKWATENGASTEGFEIANFEEEGFGLKATREIKAEELFLWVPRKLLMTVESAKNSVLGSLYSQDRILQAMGNITLAFHLLCERANPNSFWLPYIQTLPSEYDTPLYFEEDEVQYLRSTQAIHDVFSQYKNTARQYAYFYKVIQTHPNASKLPLKDSFTYDDYRWAVSSVMTRQNQIPTEDGSRVTLALIPLWDMCNHTNGLITTGYNLEDDRCECVALQDFKAGEQIYIFYGTRSNAEFVIHSGFFFDNNSHDRVKIKLGVSKSDRLYAMKAEVLARAGIPTSSVFALHSIEPPISAQLLAFLRVFCMNEEELKEHLIGEHAIDKIFTLGNSEFPISWDNEVKLWTFLEARASLLLKTYKTTVEDDKSFLETHDLTSHATMAIKLRLGEKEILEKAVKSAAASREYYTKQMADGAPLPKYEESNIALLENTVADSRLPIVLRNLDDVEEQGDLKIDEAMDAEVTENGFVNGENSLFNGTKSESENLIKEESNRETEDAKESSSESTDEVKE